MSKQNIFYNIIFSHFQGSMHKPRGINQLKLQLFLFICSNFLAIAFSLSTEVECRLILFLSSLFFSFTVKSHIDINLTQIYLDPSRHEIYKNQYRAMFVKNCSVNTAERLRYPAGGKGKKRRKRKAQPQQSPLEDLESIDKTEELTMAEPSAANETDEIYYPVKCTECGTEVGVCDMDEVFHFFNVLSSHS